MSCRSSSSPASTAQVSSATLASPTSSSTARSIAASTGDQPGASGPSATRSTASPISAGHSSRGSGGIRTSSGVSPTVDPDHLAGDVAGLVADQERAGGGDVLGPSGAADRRARRVMLDPLAEEAPALRSPQ